ncbi:MFS transporter [Aquibacillus albus]|uniref:DHA1 family bicyclomycin/chloramphenicol resistance-like MFS transporter n=1 Tax=Aquibacillus albus TaxID=1168171 RepID=A0ABS2MWJ1_9BACI|nr:MFS transporter [Aquibacillus albus]MBM7570220.1 DHA1 family bicyclomycin/chloramphenicol resistance-like MFS transporter [Aquibacillus albus]
MDEKRKRMNVHFLASGGMLATLSQLIFIPSIILIRDELHATNFEISLMVAGFTIAQALAQLVYGPIVDRYPAKNVLLIGLSISGLASLGIFFAHTVELIILLRLLQGLSVAAGSICGNALIADMYKGTKRDKALTVFQMYFSIGAASGPAIGAVMRLFLDWRYVFLFLAIWSIIVVLLLYKNLSFTESISVESFSLRQAVKSVQHFGLISICLAGAGVAFAIQSFHINIGFLFTDYLSIHDDWTGFVFMAIPLGVFTGTNISRLLLSRFSREKILVLGLSAMMIASGLILLPLFFFPLSWMVMTIIVLLYVNGISLGLTFPMVAAIAIQWFAHIRGTALSVVFFTRSIGATLGPILTGMVISWQGVPAVYSLIFLIAICSLSLCYLGLTINKRNELRLQNQQRTQAFHR